MTTIRMRALLLPRPARAWALLLLLTVSLLLSACTQPVRTVDVQDHVAGDEAEAPAEEEAEEAVATAGDAAHGEELFTVCGACHGPEGEGVEGLGKELRSNAFLAGLSDDEAVAFLKEGRPSSHELNTTGIDMPPKGGNPALSDEDLLDIVAYMRTME